MNPITTLRSQGNRTLFLCLTAALLAAAASSARPAPRSEMVVPGYKACVPRAASQPAAGATPAAQTHADQPTGDTRLAQAPAPRCAVRVLS